MHREQNHVDTGRNFSDAAGSFQAVHYRIDKSSITMSGFISRTLSTAIAPFSASPQTFQSVFSSTAERRTLRTEGLSSTIRMDLATILSPAGGSCDPGSTCG